MAVYEPWEILIAVIPSSDGSAAEHAHPCIYLGPSPSRPDCLIVVGITSQRRYADRDSVLMPWDLGGHAVTGLNKECWAQLRWRPHIAMARIRKSIGSVPPDLRAEIARRLREIVRT